MGSIRGALSIYYGDLEGSYPDNMASLTLSGKYLQSVPVAKAPNYHGDTSTVILTSAANDGKGWAYNNVAGTADYGNVLVNCTHTDSKGSVWTAY